MMPLSISDVSLMLRIKKNRLSKYMNVFSHTSKRERLELFYLARSLPEQAKALEIGSYLGSSALLICGGMRASGGELYCVDTWENQTMGEGERDTFASFLHNVTSFSHVIRTVRKRSEQLTHEDVGRVLLDFVFIDGDHDEHAVRLDFEKVRPWVKASGLVAFHDCSSSFPGVGKVVGEAMATGEWLLRSKVESLAVLQRC